MNNAKEFYNLHSQGYVQKWDQLFVDSEEPKHYLRRKLFEDVLKMSHIRTESRVVEIGCGTGLVLKEILRYTDRVVGVDVSEAMLRRVADSTLRDRKVAFVDDIADVGTHPEAEVLLTEGDFTSLKLPENYFDRIIAVEVLRYIDDIDRCFAYCRSIMKPDTRFVFTVTNPCSCSWFPLKYKLRKHFKMTDPKAELVQYFVTEKAVRAKLRKAGFDVVGFKRTGLLTMNPLLRRFIRSKTEAAKIRAWDDTLAGWFPFKKFFDTFVVAVKRRPVVQL